MNIHYLAKLKERGKSFLEEAGKNDQGEINPNII